MYFIFNEINNTREHQGKIMVNTNQNLSVNTNADKKSDKINNSTNEMQLGM